MIGQEQFNISLQQSRNLCSKSEKCSFDIKQYLTKKDVSNENIIKIIDVLIEEKFIDESRYTEFFVNDKLKFNKWGKIKIRHVLRQKNIKDTIVSKVLSNIDSIFYMQILRSVMKQKHKTVKQSDSLKAKVSIVRFMSGRGFEYELIMKSLDDIIKPK